MGQPGAMAGVFNVDGLALELVKYVNANYPDVYIVARAIHRQNAYKLYNAGCRDIIRQRFDSAVRAGRSALASSFEPGILVHEHVEYMRRTREYLDRYAGVMQGNSPRFATRLDRGWVPPTFEDVETESAKDDS